MAPHNGNRFNKKRCMLIICRDTATSDKSLEEICKAKKYLPQHKTVLKWLLQGGTVCDNYALAKTAQADYIAFDTIRISREENNPNKARNMIDANKWVASKLHPKKYGDKIEFNGSLETVNRDPASLETALAVSALLNKIAARAGIELIPSPPIEHKP